MHRITIYLSPVISWAPPYVSVDVLTDVYIGKFHFFPDWIMNICSYSKGVLITLTSHICQQKANVKKRRWVWCEWWDVVVCVIRRNILVYHQIQPSLGKVNKFTKSSGLSNITPWLQEGTFSQKRMAGLVPWKTMGSSHLPLFWYCSPALRFIAACTGRYPVP